MGHIQLSRSADLVVVAPATANILARMAAGLADDLATTRAAGDRQAGAGGAGDERADVAAPGDRGQHGDAARRAACMWSGRTRARWPATNSAPAAWPSRRRSWPRSRRCCRAPRGRWPGRHALVTSGPTHEPIDPVRYIANRVSGRQGHAIAAALAGAGRAGDAGQRPGRAARSARRDGAPGRDRGARCWPRARRRCRPMSRCCAAAVADWRVAEPAGAEDQEGRRAARRRRSSWCRNPDILATLRAPRPAAAAPGGGLRGRDGRPAGATPRPSGGARAATGSSPTTSAPATGIMGGAENEVHLITADGRRGLAAPGQGRGRARLARAIAAALA